MDYEDRLELFKAELSLISRSEIQKFIKACIKEAPDYVFTDCPSSSSGKYHPIEELGPDGNIIHTRKAFALAYDLCRALDIEEYRDEVCGAVLLHDLRKQGKEKSGHTVREHPQLMADLISEIYNRDFKTIISESSFSIMYWGIASHYGRWTQEKLRKPIERYTRSELAVYIADYIVSKRFVHIDINRIYG